MRKYIIGLVLTLNVLMILWMDLSAGWRVEAANLAPTLAIPTGIVGVSGELVTAPVDFRNDGRAISSTTFSIDFDESCLAFNASDSDGNGTPDAVRFQVPGAFRGSAAYDPVDSDGEIDITIADFSPPISTLPDTNALVEIDFTAVCTPTAGETITAPVAFSAAPVATFGDPSGDEVAGASSDGSVVIQEAPEATATLTPTLSPTASATPTPTFTSTATASPTLTATPANTPRPTPTGLVPTALLLKEISAHTVKGSALVAWHTESEWGLLGFYLDRSQREPDGTWGPVTRLTPLIVSRGAEGGDYQVADSTIAANVRYRYQLRGLLPDGQAEELIATLEFQLTGEDGGDEVIYLPLVKM